MEQVFFRMTLYLCKKQRAAPPQVLLSLTMLEMMLSSVVSISIVTIVSVHPGQTIVAADAVVNTAATVAN